MDPFNMKKDEFTFEEDNKITMWKSKKGRKTNTYISGWNLEKSELKSHLKTLKKMYGCNGSLKLMKTEYDKEYFIMHLQGDKESELISYLVENGVSIDNIVKKG